MNCKVCELPPVWMTLEPSGYGLKHHYWCTVHRPQELNGITVYRVETK